MQLPDPTGSSFLQILPQIKTPLMFAGLVLFILYLLFKSQLDKMKTIFIFVLALVAECAALYGYLHTPAPPVAVLDGVVYSPKGSNKGVPKATVYLAIQGNPVLTDLTQETGYYGFPIKPSDYGKHADLYVSASGYNDSGMVSVNLAASMNRSNFWLDADESKSANSDVLPAKLDRNSEKKAFPSSGTKSTPIDTSVAEPSSCLTGDWAEVLKGRAQDALPNVWTATLQGSNLTFTRRDNFASMELAQFGQDYKGDLKWGNGDVWHNIALTPAKDCKTIDTNVAWTYLRK